MKMRRAWVAVSLCVGASLFAREAAGTVGAQRTFVSALTGSDANGCLPTAPCRTFAHALSLTAPGGEVVAMDSGGYGPLTVSFAVTIVAAPGAYAGISVLSGDGVAINVAVSDTVVLRGLTINGLGGANGVHFNSGGTLFVESCVLSNFTGAGILMSAPGNLSVKATDARGCGLAGIQVSNSTGNVFTTIDHCHLDGNQNGYQAQSTATGNSQTSAYYSTANFNYTGWICANASDGQNQLNLDFCTANQNTADGVYTDATGVTGFAWVLLSGCVITNNGAYGIEQKHGSLVMSRGNNTVVVNFLGNTTGTINSYTAI
jgi:hypothetical protein